MGVRMRYLACAGLLGLLALLGVKLTLRLLASRPTPAAVGEHAEAVLKPDELRARAIRQTIEEIEGECQRNAGGDWGRWEEQLAPYRASLAARVQEARPLHPLARGTFEAQASVLAATDDFPLFESAPVNYLNYLLNPLALEGFRKGQPVQTAARWLKLKGIDLLFVAVPKMTEVYPEHFAENCPKDRIVGVWMRRILLVLLQADVEVVDVLPLLLSERDKPGAVLYQPADPHWAPRAQAAAARLIGRRLKRYDVVQSALAGPSVLRQEEAPYTPVSLGACYPALTEEQQRLAEKVHPTRYTRITTLDGSIPGSDSSPVLLIGDSYNHGMNELLAKEINLPLRCRNGGGQTTQAFNDFLREPALLQGVRVVVWLVCSSSLQSPWPLPQPIREAARK